MPLTAPYCSHLQVNLATTALHQRPRNSTQIFNRPEINKFFKHNMNVVASIAAVVGLVFNFATAIKRCNDIRGRYKGADQTISSIKQELEVLQSALQELANLMIHDPSALSSRWDTSKTLPTTFRRALNGFDGTITNLLRTLGRLSGERLRSIDRMKVVWNENGMEEHRRQLEGQTMALQLL